MDGTSVMAFWAVSFLFVLTPGADWAYAISAGLHERVVAPAVGGMLGGHLTHTLLVAAGVAALVARVPAVLTGLTFAGAGYLVWLGISSLICPVAAPVDGGATPGSARVRAVRGWGISGLNPKVFLLFLALLPQFVRTAAPWPVPVQVPALGVVHTASCAAIYTAVALTARRVLRARPATARLVTRVSAVVMIALGVALAVEKVLA